MNIAKLSIERPLNTWLIVVICLLGGIWGFNTVGKLEDPAFTIPNAIINTPYPGATAVEVEEEVTERLERAIQEMEQIDVIKSMRSLCSAARSSGKNGSLEVSAVIAAS